MWAEWSRAAARAGTEPNVLRAAGRVCGRNGALLLLVSALLLLGGCARTPAPTPVGNAAGEPDVQVISAETPQWPTPIHTEIPTDPPTEAPTQTPTELATVLPTEPPAQEATLSPLASPAPATEPTPTVALLDLLQSAVATRSAQSPLETPTAAPLLLPTLTPRPGEETQPGESAPPTAPVAPSLAPSGEAAPPTESAPGGDLAPDGEVRTAQVPILMYHYLSTPPSDADLYRRDLSLAPEQFAAHLDRITAAGYTTISLYTLAAHLMQGAPLPEKPVVLTFDDGYRDSYENAFPLLRARGMTATFFVLTDFIDEQREGYLTWDMAREMLAGGMFIESHGRNHVSLRGKESDYLIWQALGSLETIQFELGVRPRFVSYPAGEYDARTLEIFRSANFWAGMTTVQGATQSSDRLFEMKRVRIRATTTADQLSILLANDW